MRKVQSAAFSNGVRRKSARALRGRHASGLQVTIASDLRHENQCGVYNDHPW